MAKNESRSERARRKGPPTYDRLASKGPRKGTVDVVLDDDAAAAHLAAVRDLERERVSLARLPQDSPERIPKALDLGTLEERAEETRAALEDATVTLELQGIGRKRYEALILEHPADPKDVKNAKDNKQPVPEYNPNTLAPALVALSCTNVDLIGKEDEPDAAYEEKVPHPSIKGETIARMRYPRADRLWDEWNVGELTQLFMVAHEVNTQRRVAGLGGG
jgi:hypothetical protein